MFSVGSGVRGRLRPSAVVLHSFYSSLSSAAAVQAERTISQGPRNDWTRDEIKGVYGSPVLDLLFHGVSTISSSTCLFSFDFCYPLFGCRENGEGQKENDHEILCYILKMHN